MAKGKKNAIVNVLFPMVDKMDFATIESTLSAADIKPRYYGKVHGASTAASTASLAAPSLVHSGIFNLKIPAAVTSKFDVMLLRMSSLSTVSCALQLIPLELVDNDDSDIMSRLVGMSATMSDTYSMLSDFYSDFTSKVVRAVATASMLSDFYSDFQSRVPKAVATSSGVSDALSKVQSDLRSYVGGVSDILSKVYGDTSNLVSRVTGIVPTSSDIVSQVWGHSAATVMKSRLSNVNSGVGKLTSRVPKMAATASVLSDFQSDFGSRVPKLVVTSSAFSDALSNTQSVIITYLGGISDTLSNTRAYVIDASAVLSDFYSDFQSRVPKAVATASRLLLLESVVSDTLSDIDSALTSQYSDLASKIGNVSVTIGASEISDIASAAAAAVGAGVASQVWAFSDASLLRVQTSNIESALDSQYTAGHPLTASDLSDLRSAIAAVGLDASAMSDIRSMVLAGVTNQSDIESKLGKLVSRVPKMAATASVLSDFYSDFGSKVPKAVATASALSDFQSDFGSKVPKAVATNSQLSDLHSKLTTYAVGASDVLSNLHGDVADLSNIVSNLHADVADMSGIVSNVYSLLSNVHADLADASAILSDIKSDAAIAESRISDIYSLVNETNKGSEKFVAATGKYIKYRTDGVTQLWSHIVASDANSVVRGAGA